MILWLRWLLRRGPNRELARRLFGGVLCEIPEEVLW